LIFNFKIHLSHPNNKKSKLKSPILIFSPLAPLSPYPLRGAAMKQEPKKTNSRHSPYNISPSSLSPFTPLPPSQQKPSSKEKIPFSHPLLTTFFRFFSKVLKKLLPQKNPFFG